MTTRQELIDLLQPLLDDERQFLADNDIPETGVTTANTLHQVISALQEPDPRVISLMRAITAAHDEAKKCESLMGVALNRSRDARKALVDAANYSSEVQSWTKTNTKGTGENAD